jgi:hypothetical protein
MGNARSGRRRREEKVPEEMSVFHGGNDLNRIDDALNFAS